MLRRIPLETNWKVTKARSYVFFSFQIPPSLIQPMDWGIIKNMKLRYRKNFIESHLSSDDAMLHAVKEFWKTTPLFSMFPVRGLILKCQTWRTSRINYSLINSSSGIDDEETESAGVEEITQICNINRSSNRLVRMWSTRRNFKWRGNHLKCHWHWKNWWRRKRFSFCAKPKTDN